MADFSRISCAPAAVGNHDEIVFSIFLGSARYTCLHGGIETTAIEHGVAVPGCGNRAKHFFNRRMMMIKNWLTALATTVAMLWLNFPVKAAEPPLVVGQDYQVLSPAQPTAAPGKIVVTEFFSYQCSHCFLFYPEVTPWAAKLPKDVMFERVPVSLGHKSWQPIAQAFYALKALGKDGQFDKAIFEAIHLQHVALADEAGITKFIAGQGVKPADFSAAYHSFSVDAEVRRAEQMMQAYRVQGTPTLVVDGKYVVMSEGTHGYGEFLARATRLIAKARAERGAR